MRLLLPLLLALGLLSSGSAGERPNVLLLCVDDLKPALGCYGDTTARTPRIDELAGRALRLDRAFCNQAVCSPSRNALMTGLRPQTLGIYDLATNFRQSRPEAITMAQHFRQHGYRTEALGKIFHVGHGNSEDAASWSVPHFQPKAVSYVKPENAAPKGPKPHPGQPWKNPKGRATESADVPDETYADGQIALEAVRRLTAAQDQDEPFFLAVGFLKPHLPFVAPQQYWDLYDPATLPLPDRLSPPEGAPDYAPQFGGELRNYQGVPAGKAPLDETMTRHLIHGYYAATSYLDAQVGIVLDALAEKGFAENTLVVLWGDHGWHLGDHGMWCKHTNYEQAARIPLLVAAPGGKGSTSAALVETVDLYPTLAEMAGLPAPADLEGRSFAGLFTDPAAASRDHIIHVYPREGRLGRAIRTERYRLVEWKVIGADPASAEIELYDYEADPAESQNLASSQPEVVRELRGLLATHPEATPQITAPKTKKSPPPGKPDRAAAFKKRDRDGDSRLTLAEFLVGQPDPDEAPKRFPVFDADGDGLLSAAEYVTGGKKKSP